MLRHRRPPPHLGGLEPPRSVTRLGPTAHVNGHQPLCSRLAGPESHPAFLAHGHPPASCIRSCSLINSPPPPAHSCPLLDSCLAPHSPGFSNARPSVPQPRPADSGAPAASPGSGRSHLGGPRLRRPCCAPAAQRRGGGRAPVSRRTPGAPPGGPQPGTGHSGQRTKHGRGNGQPAQARLRPAAPYPPSGWRAGEQQMHAARTRPPAQQQEHQ